MITIEITGKAEGVEDCAHYVEIEGEEDKTKALAAASFSVVSAMLFSLAEKMVSDAEGDLGDLTDQAIEAANLDDATLIIPPDLLYRAFKSVKIPAVINHYLTDPNKWYLSNGERVLSGTQVSITYG